MRPEQKTLHPPLFEMGLRTSRILAGILTFLPLCAIVCAARGGPELPKPAVPRTAEVLVAYYSVTTNTEQMAASVVEGIRRIPGVTVKLRKADEVTKEDLQRADGIVLGSPTYYGNLPGKMKTILDDWAWNLKVDFTDKVGGAFSTGGGPVGGKEFVVISLLVFMLQNRMVVAGPLYQNEEGIWGELGASAMTGPLDPGVNKGERESAERLGERVAALASRMKSHTR